MTEIGVSPIDSETAQAIAFESTGTKRIFAIYERFGLLGGGHW